MITFDDIRSAQQVIAGQLHLTPVFSSEMLGRRIGARLMVKAELFQKTGSFKPRGVLNKLRSLSDEEKARGLITISAGNHAQALAWGARQIGAACTVVMHAAASRSKVAAAEGYGATVVLYGTPPEAFAKMDEIRVERNLTLVHPFDDPLVIAGQGTVGAEIAEQVPDVTKIVVGVGGGGLIGGIAVAAKHLRPGVKVYGVEPEGASSMVQSRAAGHAVRLEKVETIADGLAPPYTSDLTFEIARKFVDDVVLVTDDQIVDAMKLLMMHCKLYVEPAGAAAVAALLSGKIPVAADDVIVAVASGGNLDLDRLKVIL
ncbi:MAG: threonine/serine dehydratase [Chloroflexi bacterium]|nr:threonine/serine dehydratase [Chloroflexota bacterium]